MRDRESHGASTERATLGTIAALCRRLSMRRLGDVPVSLLVGSLARLCDAPAQEDASIVSFFCCLCGKVVFCFHVFCISRNFFVFVMCKAEDLAQRSFWKDGGGVMEPCREPGTVGDPALRPAAVSEGYPCQVRCNT